MDQWILPNVMEVRLLIIIPHIAVVAVLHQKRHKSTLIYQVTMYSSGRNVHQSCDTRTVCSGLCEPVVHLRYHHLYIILDVLSLQFFGTLRTGFNFIQSYLFLHKQVSVASKNLHKVLYNVQWPCGDCSISFGELSLKLCCQKPVLVACLTMHKLIELLSDHVVTVEFHLKNLWCPGNTRKTHFLIKQKRLNEKKLQYKHGLPFRLYTLYYEKFVLFS